MAEKTPDDRPVGGGEIERVEFRERNPAHGGMFVRMRRGARGREPADKRLHRDGNVAVIVLEGGQRPQHLDFHAEFLAKFAEQGGLGRLTGLNRAARKLPFEGEVLVRRTLGDEHVAGAIDDDGGDDGKGRLICHGANETPEILPAATFPGLPGYCSMKTLLKILLVVLAVIVAVKLLPVAMVVGCVLAGLAAVVTAVGVSLVGGVLALGLFLALVLSPIWLPVMALIGIIALFKKASAKPVTA